MNTHALASLVVAGLAAAASAQLITTPGITARLDLSWQEDPAFPHNDNGFLEPGERALILMTASFTGQYTVVNFNPSVGTFSSGTVTGFGSGYLDLRSNSPDPSGLYNGGLTVPASSSSGPNANQAGTAGYGVRDGWRLGGNVANGTPTANGFQNIGPGQLPSGPSAANTAVPIANIVRLGWLPNSYADRTVTFSVRPAWGDGWFVGLYLALDSQTGIGAFLQNTQITYGSVDIPIRSVPAPATTTLIGTAGLAGVRRPKRRR